MRKFLDGLLFGCGLAVAFVVVWTIWSLGMAYVMPRMMDSAMTTTREPEFKNPAEAQVTTPAPGQAPEAREFSFFKHSGERMKIPEGGGILAMSPMSTARNARRPSTYQLWLTESRLWQIRTVEEKAEIEELPYPPGASVAELDRLIRRNLGVAARQSTMTVSAVDLNSLKTTGDSSRDASMNGKLRISVDGVVFFQPDPY